MTAFIVGVKNDGTKVNEVYRDLIGVNYVNGKFVIYRHCGGHSVAKTFCPDEFKEYAVTVIEN